MDFTPHTDEDLGTMLGRLGLDSVDDLYRHLPEQVVLERPLDLDSGLAEPDVMAMVDQLAERNTQLVCFAGGGIYDHFLPPVVRSLTMRPEFVTSYTPYQPEVSQGVLQLLFEFQSMVGSHHRPPCGKRFAVRRSDRRGRGRAHGGGGNRQTGGLVVDAGSRRASGKRWPRWPPPNR